MCETCGCSAVGKPKKPEQYNCGCEEDYSCSLIEFDKEPKSVPYCCGIPMKRVK